MALILFAQTMFGNLVALRILRNFRDRSLLSSACLTKIGIAFACGTSLGASCMLFYPITPRLSLFSTVFAVFTLIFFLHTREKHQIEILLAHFPRFLDHWILNLRVGLSPTASAKSALITTNPAFRALISPLLASTTVQTERKSHLFLRDRIIRELSLVQATPHNTIARLESLRDFLRRESDFRRKSGHAVRQAAIQSIAMLALHFALCGFVIARSGWWRSLDLILIATALSISGALILRLIARRVRWTI